MILLIFKIRYKQQIIQATHSKPGHCLNPASMLIALEVTEHLGSLVLPDDLHPIRGEQFLPIHQGWDSEQLQVVSCF